jgi:hypothetical protein
LARKTVNPAKPNRTHPPKWIEPQLTRLVDEAPNGPDWLHEIKYDGYRMHARIDGSDIRLLTRTGLDWSHRYQATIAALRAQADAERTERLFRHDRSRVWGGVARDRLSRRRRFRLGTVVEGEVSGTVTVERGARLIGSGKVGSVTVAEGGKAAPMKSE